MEYSKALTVLVAVAMFCSFPVFGESLEPLTVSPGAVDRFTGVEVRCPTFSWRAVPGAVGYEVVVYELPPQVDLAGWSLDEAVEVLFVELPSGVTAWTPSFESGLARGMDHVWFVRGVFEDGSAGGTSWSQARFFRVVGGTLEPGIGVQSREVGESSGEGEGEDAARSRGTKGEHGRSAIEKRVGEENTKDVGTAMAAIRGEMPDAAGETYGVVGTSNSPDGAGLGAVNNAGGPDLVLDGAEDGETDTRISQSGIDRSSATAETFSINNSGGGGMTLDVNGVEVVTTLTDQDTIGGLSCAGGELAKWNGSDWVCDADLDTDTLVGLSCGTGQVAKWSGSEWTCAPDLDTDTDTLAGLSCGSGQVAKWTGSLWACAPDENTLGALGCTTDQIAKWNGAAWVCAADDDTEYTFGPGLIVDNGQVVIDPSAFSTRISIVDLQDPQAGIGNSLAIGTDGLGLISYFSYTSTSLKVAHCQDAPCTNSTISTLLGGVTVSETSLAIGADGFGIIAFHDSDNNDLMVAHCNDAPCTSASINAIDSADDVGSSPSLAIGADGLAIISYFDATNYDLKVAHCDNVRCSSATVTVVDAFLNVGEYTALAIGADGLPIIAYYDGTFGDLKVAHCEDLACSVRTTRTVSQHTSDIGLYPSVAIGVDGLALISYYDLTDSRIRVAHCEDIACDSWVLSILKMEYGERHTSIAIGADGLGLIGLFDAFSYELQVAHCLDTQCYSAEISRLGFVGLASTMDLSLAVGTDGRGLLSHAFHPEGGSPAFILKIAHLPIGF